MLPQRRPSGKAARANSEIPNRAVAGTATARFGISGFGKQCLASAKHCGIISGMQNTEQSLPKINDVSDDFAADTDVQLQTAHP